uniref:Uncharacterized protein n=1 Tax=Romanomermis culicivorax TaxID=13658 RepID=A0A915KJ27_ROMCU
MGPHRGSYSNNPLWHLQQSAPAPPIVLQTPASALQPNYFRKYVKAALIPDTSAASTFVDTFYTYCQHHLIM